jgi:UDPglucose 6-dehydrogenase
VFRTPDFEAIEKVLPSKLIFDGRNLFEIQTMKELGFTYYSIGRATV